MSGAFHARSVKATSSGSTSSRIETEHQERALSGGAVKPRTRSERQALYSLGSRERQEAIRSGRRG